MRQIYSLCFHLVANQAGCRNNLNRKTGKIAEGIGVLPYLCIVKTKLLT